MKRGPAHLPSKSHAWRFTVLYIRTRSRNTTSESFTTSENIVNVQMKRVW